MEQEHPTGGVPRFEETGEPPRHEVQRRLYRSQRDRVVAGVCGGLGHYFGVDPVLIRLAFVALTLVGGAGILIYLIAAVVLPLAPEDEDAAGPPQVAMPEGRLIVGGLFLLVGAYLLLREIIPWYSDRIVWGVILVAVGVAVILRGTDR